MKGAWLLFCIFACILVAQCVAQISTEVCNATDPYFYLCQLPASVNTLPPVLTQLSEIKFAFPYLFLQNVIDGNTNENSIMYVGDSGVCKPNTPHQHLCKGHNSHCSARCTISFLLFTIVRCNCILLLGLTLIFPLAQILFLLAGNGYLYRSTDSGAHWNLQDTQIHKAGPAGKTLVVMNMYYVNELKVSDYSKTKTTILVVCCDCGHTLCQLEKLVLINHQVFFTARSTESDYYTNFRSTDGGATYLQVGIGACYVSVDFNTNEDYEDFAVAQRKSGTLKFRI